MRFAILGNHPDGLAMARALSANGNTLVAVCETDPPDFAAGAKVYSDVEDLLADPAVETVIVAGPLGKRFEQLRAIQSERGAYCVHPCDAKLERAYEASWMQSETKQPLVPLLPDGLHPAYLRLAEIVRESGGLTLLKWEDETGSTDDVDFRGWDILRRIGGEIVKVSGFTANDEMMSAAPLLFNGSFEKGGLFQATLLPNARRRITLVGPTETVEFDAAEGRLHRIWADGATGEEVFEPWDGWAALAMAGDRVTWHDAIRSQELDDALRYSVEKRKASDLEYQDATPDVAGKGKLTLIGCGMIWMILLIFGLSIWVPAIRWAIVPMLLGFFALVALRWLGRKP